MNQKKNKLDKVELNACFLNKKNPFELFKVWMAKAKKTEMIFCKFELIKLHLSPSSSSISMDRL